MSEETEVVELDKDLEKIAASLDKLTLLQASKLVQHLEDKWGVSAAAPVAVAAPAAASGGEEVAEQTSFDAVLEAFGEKKIQVIKEVRAITNLGLKEAKELVDSAPKTIKEGCSKEEAEEIKQRIEAVGGTVKLA
ncbi:MAG: 50S ribosomal protein L7/L12 [Planctomycetota bacterium]|nr:50S ribosomal protein L7/L12 [Planctomycetota bacterium]